MFLKNILKHLTYLKMLTKSSKKSWTLRLSGMSGEPRRHCITEDWELMDPEWRLHSPHVDFDTFSRSDIG